MGREPGAIVRGPLHGEDLPVVNQPEKEISGASLETVL
jgi:hypothetical protein